LAPGLRPQDDNATVDTPGGAGADVYITAAGGAVKAVFALAPGRGWCVDENNRESVSRDCPHPPGPVKRP
jgi:hypothetical protein